MFDRMLNELPHLYDKQRIMAAYVKWIVQERQCVDTVLGMTDTQLLQFMVASSKQVSATIRISGDLFQR